ncbi:rer1 protein [Vairimorpha apis BRL 01]|uniref:Protein RER1 n=1 Tax=Vairimorpha apis BRL 01 TaxID=1037528 RepID=T0LCF4_9MICR|nr:rer1 protein [Vairimorpha apis BRL 01]
MDLSLYTQIVLDYLAPLPYIRWSIFAIILFLYILRIYFTNAYYLVTYCLGIYLIHGIILFLTPKGDNISDPFENYEQEEDDYVPDLIDNQFRPITRNLPEYDFWWFCLKVILCAFFASFFGIMDIPVYTPILVIYFILMVGFTLKSLYKHMKKYKYNPFFMSKDFYKD